MKLILTLAMRKYGKIFDLTKLEIKHPIIDKHSAGNVGD